MGPWSSFPRLPAGRNVVIALAAAAAYFVVALPFADAAVWDEPTFDATAVTVLTTAWLASMLLGSWVLGRDWGAAHALLLTGLQIPMSLLTTGTLGPPDYGVWWLIMALFGIVVGGITGALADHYREAKVRTAELARKHDELEKSTHALMQSEKMFREFAEHVEVGVWIARADAQGKPDYFGAYMNPAARRMFGDKVGTAEWGSTVHADDLPHLMAVDAMLLGGRPTDVEFRVQDGRGGYRWLRSQGFPISDRDGALTSVVGMIDDVTERKDREARRELIERRERMSALGTLVAGVAHEINNPLTYLMGNMQLAQAEVLKASLVDEPATHLSKVDRLLRTSVEGGERIAKIVKALRAVTRTGAAGEREPVRLNVVATNVYELMRTNVPRTIDLRLDLGEDDPVVSANATEIHQVLLNLATNAVQAIGTVSRGRVTIKTRIEDGRAILAVRDDGPGIAPEVRMRLFTPFYTTKPEGTGLGLSLAHAIVQDHGGEIDVESAPGEGALFRVRLPRAEVGSPTATIARPAAPVATEVRP